MIWLRSIAGTLVGALLILLLTRVVPFTPDLSDWGGRAYPQSYLTPLFLLTLISYISGWTGAWIAPRAGRLTGMMGSIFAAVILIGWNYNAAMLKPLFQHPAYPLFSDHALLALALLLAGGHLGGLKVENGYLSRSIARPADPEKSPSSFS